MDIGIGGMKMGKLIDEFLESRFGIKIIDNGYNFQVVRLSVDKHTGTSSQEVLYEADTWLECKIFIEDMLWGRMR